MIAPGAMLGVLGGGQLGRMFALAAQAMGYRVTVLDPDANSPTGEVVERHLRAAYTDVGACDELLRTCAAVTTEFENVPAQTLRTLAARLPVSPAADAVETAQNRNREKAFFRDCGVDTVASCRVASVQDLDEALETVAGPAILKTAQLGYDGKGQRNVETREQAVQAFEAFGGVECVLESRVQLQCELSVIVARNRGGQLATFPVAENEHSNGILATTRAPARVSDALARQALDATRLIAERLDYCGVLAVEYFFTADGRLLANEMAPRPHNSGHYTIDACITSQFEQQVRAMCDLPLGETELLRPAVMVNLLGDLWQNGEAPDWSPVLQTPGAHLHLYGKREARPGRKMGHFTCLDGDLEVLGELAQKLFATLDGKVAA